MVYVQYGGLRSDSPVYSTAHSSRSNISTAAGAASNAAGGATNHLNTDDDDVSKITRDSFLFPQFVSH